MARGRSKFIEPMGKFAALNREYESARAGAIATEIQSLENNKIARKRAKRVYEKLLKFLSNAGYSTCASRRVALARLKREVEF